ncbi:MAG: gas vesicle protein [Chloroflexi bacterium]|nr:gas vesicle protein [Chloroflexota bacterium]
MDDTITKERQVTILDLLDRILDKGVIIKGDITISVADVDLAYVGLQVLLSSVETIEHMRKVALGLETVHATTND